MNYVDIIRGDKPELGKIIDQDMKVLSASISLQIFVCGVYF